MINDDKLYKKNLKNYFVHLIPMIAVITSPGSLIEVTMIHDLIPS